MKKIIIVSHYFYPENTPRAFRTTELANELARQGNDVTIITHKNEKIHNELEKIHGYTIKDLGKLKFKSIEPTSNGFMFNLKRILRRILLLLFEFPNIEIMFKVKNALKGEQNYDLLISVAVPYPIHWGVAWARNKKNSIAKTWVADCGDPYMGCKTDSFKKIFYFSFVEKWFCRKTDFISVPNQDHVTQYYEEFHSKMRIIPQGFRFEKSNLFHGEIKNKIPTFAFAGVLLKNTRNPQVILNFLSELNIKFKFILFTNSTDLIEPYLHKLKDKIEVRPYIPREELLYELSQMDFLINIEFHSSVKSNSPSKLIDYAIVKRPILSLNMENFDSIKVDEFLNGDYSRQLIINDIDRFKIENVTKEFLKLTE
jgi:glycosyltransferase involved in cell wall biosynthesis